MFSSFMGGGNSSQTATQGGNAPTSAPKEESKSGFKAFGGKGKSLGSDLGKPATSTKASTKSKQAFEERKQAATKNPTSALVKG